MTNDNNKSIHAQLNRAAQHAIKEGGPQTITELLEFMMRKGYVFITINGETFQADMTMTQRILHHSGEFTQDDTNRWHLTEYAQV